jgi:aminomethyltransferase
MPDDVAAIRKTPLNGLLCRLGARMVNFAGYEMPLNFRDGIIKEHLHTRAAAGLFDVSHMGQLRVRSRSGSLQDVAAALERLIPADVQGIPAGRQRYGVFTNEDGGILDDLMITNCGDGFAIVVNAGRKDADEEHLRNHLPASCNLERRDDLALLALQGPAAERVLSALDSSVVGMRFLDVRPFTFRDTPCLVSRSGYTGEDGFEISVPAGLSEELAVALLDHPSVLPIGLGARDSLRLEAGLCLYGSDIDTETSPVEAALDWSIQKVRRTNGARAGGFPGSSRILKELEQGVSRRRVGLRVDGRIPVRGGTALFQDDRAATPVGQVTSGCFAPSLNAPIAMGYVASSHARIGAELAAEVRGNRISMTVCALPFVSTHYKRT